LAGLRRLKLRHTGKSEERGRVKTTILGGIIMAKYRKLGRTSSQRKALLRNQVTMLLNKGKIVTTEAKAKEVQKIAEKMIALAIREKDNFDEVTVDAKVPVKDKDGKRVKEVVDGKKVTKFETVQKTIKKDRPSRLHARRQMLKVLYTLTEKGEKKSETKVVNLPNKLFEEIAPKYENRNGGYTRIVKIGQRKGDGAMEVLLELI
jgi:large subunit ribosomal protein L17